MEIAKQLPCLITNENLDICSCAWLVSLLSYYECCDETISGSNINYWAFNELRKQLLGEKKVVTIVPLVRCLSNMCAASDMFFGHLLAEDNFMKMLFLLLNYSYESVRKETALLVANIVNSPNPEIQLLINQSSFKVTIEETLSKAVSLF